MKGKDVGASEAASESHRPSKQTIGTPSTADILKSSAAKWRGVLRLPAWLALIGFLPLQIWLFVELKQAWGWWWTIGAFLVLGFLGTRAARAGWFREAFFPRWADRWEKRRHLFQGALLLAAGVTFILPWGPQPWLPAAALTTLVKASVR